MFARFTQAAPSSLILHNNGQGVGVRCNAARHQGAATLPWPRF